MKEKRLTERDLLQIKRGHEHSLAEKKDGVRPTAGMLINEISKLFSIALKQTLPHGAGMTYSRRMILHYLSHNETASLTDLIEHSHLSGASLSVELSEMEHCGLIEKSKNPTDRRGVCIRLTDAGRELQRGIRESLSSLDAALMRDITEEKKEELCTLLRTVRDSILSEIKEGE
ncbi:MAG: MarR family transcriptional regulator [Clostridia bacterium]|nr:MarR family transcriptional regulator [Clostridia bacterium]